jgi:hypothetical protein
MKQAKAFGLIDKIPTGRRRPAIKAAPSKAIARARGVAFAELRVRAPNALAHPSEQMTHAECSEALTRRSFEVLLAILDHQSADKLEVLGLQAQAARQLLSLCK